MTKALVRIIYVLFALAAMGSLFLAGYLDAGAAISPAAKPYVVDTALVPKVRYVDSNDSTLQVKINELVDSSNIYFGGGLKTSILKNTSGMKFIIDSDSNETGRSFIFANHLNDTLMKIRDDSTLQAVKGSFSGTLGVTGVATFTAASVHNGGLTLGGRFIDKTTSLTSNTTLSTTHSTVFASATGGAFVLTLPAASGNGGLTYTIFKTDASANTVTVDGNASETIGGALTIVLCGNTSNSRLVIVCDGTNWQVKELHESGSFSAAASGFSACSAGSLSGSTCVATAYYIRNGKSVILNMPSILGTSNATTMTISGLPAALVPTRSQFVIFDGVWDFNGGLTNNIGVMGVSSSGSLNPYFRTSLTAAVTDVFHSPNTKGFDTHTISYNLQ